MRKVMSDEPRTHSSLFRPVAAVAPGSIPVHPNEALAFPLPILVICQLRGVPPHDQQKFRRLVDGFLSVSKLPSAEVRECREGLWAYLGALISAKREQPSDD